jgi:hypothetical protein
MAEYRDKKFRNLGNFWQVDFEYFVSGGSEKQYRAPRVYSCILVA